ncbi:MAG: host attachment protein [Yoonia sp.]|nr:host attachment protein [Yoonia sp.]
MKLEHNAWVIVADGEKYLVLQNHGDEKFIDLRVIAKEVIDNPAARDLSSDRPGRMPDDGHGYSALQETDWHVVEKQRFSKELGAKLVGWAAHDRFQKLVVIADPKTLGDLRGAYCDTIQKKLVAEIDKDCTNMPIDQIEATLGQL